MNGTSRKDSFSARLRAWFTKVKRAAFARVRGWHSRPQPSLRLCESLALGERRFLSVVEFGQRRFLVGGTANSLAMLATLSDPPGNDRGTPTWEFVEGELVRCG